MPKRKKPKTYPMEKLDEALHHKFKRQYLTEWSIVHGAYVTDGINGGLTDYERTFIDGYMAAVTDCMYGGALK